VAGIKSLAKETAVYGLSSIVGRFLNWCLVPLYVYVFAPGEYGIVSYLYAYTAVILVILNYGMETGYFRFANKEGNDPQQVYTTTLISVGTTSLLFILLLTIFLKPISKALLLPDDSLFIWLLGVIVALDAFSNIPFAALRFKRKAYRFAGIKIVNVGVNIGLNLFFLLACPKLHATCPSLISWFYDPLGGEAFGIGWIFVANMISTLCVLALLLPEIICRKYSFNTALWKKMLSYSWPLLILGVAGIMSQNMGQLLIPYIFSDNLPAANAMVGIYGANIKIAIVMVMFTQAFRYAYEPFIFAQAKGDGSDKKQAYSDAMKFFVIFGLVIFLGVMYFLPILKHFVSPAYWDGLAVVPVMMMAELFFGIFFNLSLWYKLTDRTIWGMYFSLTGFVLMLVLNLILVPMIGIPNGYMGSAWAAFIAYFAIMALSYFTGRKYYPISYPIKRMALYTLLALVLWFLGCNVCEAALPTAATYLVKTLLLIGYLAVIAYYEEIPMVSARLRRLVGKK
jgi:O-antigen/teichoic acid export membrane protein